MRLCFLFLTLAGALLVLGTSALAGTGECAGIPTCIDVPGPWVAVPAPPDTFAFELRRAGGFEHLSGGPSRPVEPAGLAFDSFGRIYVTDAAGCKVGDPAAMTRLRAAIEAALGDGEPLRAETV